MFKFVSKRVKTKWRDKVDDQVLICQKQKNCLVYFYGLVFFEENLKVSIKWLLPLTYQLNYILVFLEIVRKWKVTSFYVSGSSPSTREDDLRVTDLLNEFQSLEEHEVKSFFATLVNNQVENQQMTVLIKVYLCDYLQVKK